MSFSIKKISFLIPGITPMICLPIEESRAFVWGLFTFVLHLGNAGAELHGSLWQDSWLAEAQLPRCQSQEEFFPETSRKCQICFLPYGQRVQVAHHVLVQVGKSAGATVSPESESVSFCFISVRLKKADTVAVVHILPICSCNSASWV